MANKHVDLFKEIIPAVDMKIFDLWDATTDDGRKEIKGDLFNLNRYISNVKHSNPEIQQHFVLTVNEYYNKNWPDLQKHPKLLWMLLCLCSYDGETTFFHEWLPLKRTKSSDNKRVQFLAEFYPNMKDADLETMAAMMTDKELKQLGRDYGLEDSEITKRLKK
jgi:hypothetical protein